MIAHTEFSPRRVCETVLEQMKDRIASLVGPVKGKDDMLKNLRDAAQTERNKLIGADVK